MVIVASLILGGGTAQQLWSDHVLQLLMLPALFIGLGGFVSSRFAIPARCLAVAILALLALQFVPVWRDSPLPGIVPEAAGTGLFSTVPQKSLDSALFAVTVLGFALFLSRFSDADQERCLRFVMLGFFVNLVVGIIQLSFDQRMTITGALPFDMHAGLFANENHFSGLIYAMIPLLAHHYLARSNRVWLYLLAVGGIVFFLFAVGSRAGMAISAVLGLLCLAWFWSRDTSPGAKTGFLAAGFVLVALSVWQVGLGTTLEGDQRWQFYGTTVKAAGDHWLTGSGLGSFTSVYPAYEPREHIYQNYANHAHNDYLELLLEAGVAGLAMVVLFFGLVLRHAGRTQYAEAAFLSILALGLHSMVDYPLRTMALAVLFAYLAAVVLSTRRHGHEAAHPHATRTEDLRGHESADFVTLDPMERVRSDEADADDAADRFTPMLPHRR